MPLTAYIYAEQLFYKPCISKPLMRFSDVDSALKRALNPNITWLVNGGTSIFAEARQKVSNEQRRVKPSLRAQLTAAFRSCFEAASSAEQVAVLRANVWVALLDRSH